MKKILLLLSLFLISNLIFSQSDGMSIINWDEGTNQTPILGIQSSGSPVINTQSLVPSGQHLGAIIFRGSDGVGFKNAASIISNADGTTGVNDMPGNIIFSTTPDGSSSVVERMRITNAGGFSFGSSGTGYGTTGQILTSNGNTPPTWQSLSSGWSLNGNTVGSEKWIGTSDNFALPFRTNNTEKIRISASGEFIIGNSAVLSGELLSAQKSYNGWTGFRIYNATSGTAASAGFGATNSSSTSISMTSYSSSYTSSGMFIASTGVVSANTSGGMNIGTTGNTSISFWTNNTKRITFDNSGRLGIATASPTEKLDVSGNIKFNGTLMPNGTAGTSGYILASAGSTNPPTWIANTIPNIQTSTSYSFSSSQTYTISANTPMVVNTNTTTITPLTLDFSSITVSAVDGQIFSFVSFGGITSFNTSGATFYDEDNTSVPCSNCSSVNSWTMGHGSKWKFVSSFPAWIKIP